MGNFDVTAPERHRSIELSDGRRLAWAEWGPEGGWPVVFCTGAGMSGTLGFGFSDLVDLNLRLMAIDRPGLGASAPHSGKTIMTWVDDIAALVQREHLPTLGVVGFSQGAPFAVGLTRLPQVKAVALVSGQDDFGFPALTAQLLPEVAGMVEAVREDAGRFEQQFAASVTMDGLWTLIMTMSAESDRAVYREPAFEALYRQALEEGFAQGTAGYARDLVNALRPWPVLPEEVQVPVDLWYGQQDQSPVHSPDFGVTLSRRFPQATLTIVSDEGASLLWTCARPILSKLHSRMRAGASRLQEPQLI